GKNQQRVNLAVFGRDFKVGKAVSYPNQQNLEPGNLYLIDHRGLVVLEYQPSLDVQENRMRHKGMLKDLKKLLNYARSS
ncbi:transmembrane cytochrome oxidase associated protein, partial [Pseudoalteromonas ruthenica]